MHEASRSVTSLKHRLLETLEEGLDGELYAVSYQGETESYDHDTFRRLYNDAVESMWHYAGLVDRYRLEAEACRSKCADLEDFIRELPED